MITKGQERCLFVWPREEFARITEKLRNAPVTEKASRDYSRVLFSGASDEFPTGRAGSPSPPPCAPTPGCSGTAW